MTLPGEGHRDDPVIEQARSELQRFVDTAMMGVFARRGYDGGSAYQEFQASLEGHGLRFEAPIGWCILAVADDGHGNFRPIYPWRWNTVANGGVPLGEALEVPEFRANSLIINRKTCESWLVDGPEVLCVAVTDKQTIKLAPNDGGEGLAGDREPRRPIPPVLVGSIPILGA